jgi:hypothetical protein
VEIVVILEPVYTEFVLSMIPPSPYLGLNSNSCQSRLKTELVYKAESQPPLTYYDKIQCLSRR